MFVGDRHDIKTIFYFYVVVLIAVHSRVVSYLITEAENNETKSFNTYQSLFILLDTYSLETFFFIFPTFASKYFIAFIPLLTYEILQIVADDGCY